MRNVIAGRYQLLGHPGVTVTLAALIVLGASAWAGARLPAARQGVEQVAVMKSIVMRPPLQPQLRVNAAGEAQEASAGVESGVPATQPQPPPPPAAIAEPQIARTGEASLFVANVDAAVRRLTRLAQRSRGAVFSLNVANENQNAGASAQIELRIPAQEFDRAMGALPQIGKIRERLLSSQDLTGDVTDSSARLRNLRQTESDIRKIMDRSGNVSQVMAAEIQLSQVREQIETLESSIASMRGRVAYATIDIDLQAEVANQPVEPTAFSQLANAWSAAVHSLARTAIGVTALILWGVVFMPVMLAAALAAWVISAQVHKKLARGAAG